MHEVEKIFSDVTRLRTELLVSFGMIHMYRNEYDGQKTVEKYKMKIDGILMSIKYFTGVDLYYFEENGCWNIAHENSEGKVEIVYSETIFSHPEKIYQ